MITRRRRRDPRPVAAIKRDKERALRVGDEHEVELLPGRLPNPTSVGGDRRRTSH